MRSWQEEVKFLRRKNSIQIVKDQRLPLWLAALVAGSRRKRNVKSQFLFNTLLLDSCLLHSGLLHSLAFQHGQLARHDICQNFYATGVLRSQNLRKKRVNHDNSKFARKQRKCLNFTTNFTFFVIVAQQVSQYL